MSRHLHSGGYRQVVGPTIINHNKSAHTYELAMRCIAKKCNLENKSEILLQRMVNQRWLWPACLIFFSKCSLLRCIRHFEAHCKDFSIDMDIKET